MATASSSSAAWVSVGLAMTTPDTSGSAKASPGSTTCAPVRAASSSRAAPTTGSTRYFSRTPGSVARFRAWTWPIRPVPDTASSIIDPLPKPLIGACIGRSAAGRNDYVEEISSRDGRRDHGTKDDRAMWPRRPVSRPRPSTASSMRRAICPEGRTRPPSSGDLPVAWQPIRPERSADAGRPTIARLHLLTGAEDEGHAWAAHVRSLRPLAPSHRPQPNVPWPRPCAPEPEDRYGSGVPRAAHGRLPSPTDAVLAEVADATRSSRPLL